MDARTLAVQANSEGASGWPHNWSPALIGFMILFAGCQRLPVVSQQLVLERSSAAQLPAGISPVGLVPDDRGRILVWSQRGDLLLYDESLRLKASWGLNARIVGAFLSSDDTLSVFTSKGIAMFPSTGNVGGFIHQPNLPPVIATAAMRSGDSWIVQAHSNSLADDLWEVKKNGAWRRIEGVPLPLSGVQSLDRRGGARRSSYYLQPHRSGILLTEARAPFRSFQLSVSNGIIQSSSLASAPMEYIAGRFRDSVSAWVSLPRVEVDGGAFQMLVDARSTGRAILVSRTGVVGGRVLRMDLPVTVVAAVPGSRTIVGFSRGDAVELIKWRLEWIS